MTQSLEWRLAFRNLFRNKRRSVSTAFGLIIAYVGLSMLFGYLNNAEISMRHFEIYLNYKGDVQIYKKGGGGSVELDPLRFQIEENVSVQVVKILKNYESDIEFFAPLQSTEALLSTGATSVPIWLQGIPPELESYVYSKPQVHECCPYIVKARSRPGMLEATTEHSDAISISQGVGELLNRTGSIQKMTLGERELSIAGLSFAGDLNAVSATLSMNHTTGMPYIEDVSVWASLASVQDLLQSKAVSQIAIFIKDDANRNRLIKKLSNDFESQKLDLEVLAFDDERVGIYYNETISFLVSMGGFIGVLILIASGLIVMNSITMSVMERLKEIGTMRALGYLPFQARSIFVKEAICISSFASFGGMVFSEVLAKIVNSLGIFYEAPGLSVPLPLQLVSDARFYLALSVCMIGISTFLTFAVVSKKSKEPITTLLLDSGASI
ncbi:MAG: ABC transporter permease [Pseudobdellovibrionaceae bacterium]